VPLRSATAWSPKGSWNQRLRRLTLDSMIHCPAKGSVSLAESSAKENAVASVAGFASSDRIRASKPGGTAVSACSTCSASPFAARPPAATAGPRPPVLETTFRSS
jgi:hypothetical protein